MKRPASPVNTQHQEHQPDVDERGPALNRRKHIIETQRELGSNSTRTLVAALNLSQLPGVAPSPGVPKLLHV